MKKILFILLIFLPLSCLAKKLTVYNESAEPMSFMFGNFACLTIRPEKFDLNPGRKQLIDITIDMHRSPRCPQGQTPVFGLLGWPSKYNPATGRDGFTYLVKFLKEPLTLPNWKCAKENSTDEWEKDFPYYCYAFPPSIYHPDFDVYAEDTYISILPPTNKHPRCI